MRILEDALELTLNDPIFEEKRKLSERLIGIGHIIFEIRHKINDLSTHTQKLSETFKKRAGQRPAGKNWWDEKADEYEERLSKAQTAAANTEKMLQDVQARVNPLNTKVLFLKSHIRRLQNLIMQQKEEARIHARAERRKRVELRKSQSNFDSQVNLQAEPAPSLNPYVVVPSAFCSQSHLII